MIEWEVVDDRLRVVDADNVELSVRGAEFDVIGRGATVPRPVDETVECIARELHFPHEVVYVARHDGTDSVELDHDGTPLELPDGEYVVDVDTGIKTYLRCTGPATIRRTDDFSSVVVTFPERRRVTIGFRSRHEFPAGTITVPESPEGVATALTYLSSAIKTTGPERSYPTLRGHPPLIEFGDDYDVPDAIADARTDVGVQLVVPPSYDALLVTAPLAYYLQANVTVESRAEPVLQVPALDRTVTLAREASLERDAEWLLRHVFFLDCLVRNEGPYGTTLFELGLLDVLGVDTDALYECSPAERLDAYLSIPYAAVEHRLPQWHLSTYVEFEPETVETLPFLLDRLSLIYAARTSELEGKELIKRSLDDFYRGVDSRRHVGSVSAVDRDLDGGPRPSSEPRPNSQSRPSSDSRPDGGPRADSDRYRGAASRRGQVATVDILKPELRGGSVHGWLADGVPIDVFKSTPAAYRNRLSYLNSEAELVREADADPGGDLDRDSDSTTVVVVLNDPEMEGEHDRVAEIYRERAKDLAIDVTVEEGLSTTELARVFETRTDFVHYIGHCETDGLRCRDGNLSASSLDVCRTQTFFLNACGSFYEGLELIERGSVAGAVTFTQVLNEHAVKVGSAFATLLIHGFSIERAMRLARRRIIMGKDYAVVGDGTHTLTQSEHRTPTTADVREIDGRYRLSLDCYSTQEVGSYYHPHLDQNEHSYLCGTESVFTLDRDELLTFLDESALPVIFDGDVYWSHDLGRRFVD